MAADVISNHDIDLVKPSKLGPRTLRVNDSTDVVIASHLSSIKYQTEWAV